MKYFLGFVTGLLFGVLLTLFYQEKQKNKEIKIQSNTIMQNIKQMNKMVVTEAYFDEVYSYNSTNRYLFDLFEFDKNVVLLVKAKVQISYDLNKMKIKFDSLHKVIQITELPKEKIDIFPNIQYYDLQQSVWNQFTKDELNEINYKAIEQIKKHINLSELRIKAKRQLFQNLQYLYILSKIYGWKIEDKHFMQNLKLDLLI